MAGAPDFKSKLPTHTYENLESSLLEPKLLKSYFLVFKFISKSLTKGSSLTGSKKNHTKNVVKYFFYFILVNCFC